MLAVILRVSTNLFGPLQSEQPVQVKDSFWFGDLVVWTWATLIQVIFLHLREQLWAIADLTGQLVQFASVLGLNPEQQTRLADMAMVSCIRTLISFHGISAGGCGVAKALLKLFRFGWIASRLPLLRSVRCTDWGHCRQLYVIGCTHCTAGFTFWVFLHSDFSFLPKGCCLWSMQ